MSAVVCQGFQSCLESTHLVETTTLMLKLVAPKSIELGRGPSILDGDSKEIREKLLNKTTINEGGNHMPKNLDLGGWNFLQSLSNSFQIPQTAMDIENSYAQPFVKQSSLLKLSEKSLELCTENLGSETGSDTMEETNIFSFNSSDPNNGKSPRREQHNSLQYMESNKVNSRNFPPPLTTISGSNSLHVRPHREGGRLIIKAMEASTTHNYFQAERSHGRLRLSFFMNPKVMVEKNEGNIKEDENEEDVEDEMNNEENQEDDEEENEMDMDGNTFDVKVEMGMEKKFQRPSRCKESGHCNNGLCNWEPFNWVATS